MSAFENIYSHLWMQVPAEERKILAEVFNLEKTGIAEIRDQSVISDGHSNDDLLLITKDKMEAFIGSEAENFARAWELTVAKARSIVNPPIEIKMPEGAQIREATPEEAAAMIANDASASLPQSPVAPMTPSAEVVVPADEVVVAPEAPIAEDAAPEVETAPTADSLK